MRGKRKDSAEEKSIRERLDAAASGQLGGAALRELAVEIAVGEVIGRDRRGKATGFAPGAVSRAMDAELLAGRDVEAMTALQKLKAWLSAVRTYIRGVLGVVRAVDKARASGKLADGNALDSFVDDLLGLNESKFSKAVESEAAAMMGEGGVSHSLTPARRGEALTHEQKQQLQDGIAASKGAIELSRQSGSYPAEQRETILAIDRTFSAETALVAAGLKPIFHEQWAFQSAESRVFVEQIKRAFPHLEAEAWDNHVAVWNPAAVAQVMAVDPAHYGKDAREAIHQAAESDAIGELLGNGARTRLDGGVTVNYLVDGEIIAGGFITTPELAESLGEQRRQAFELSFGKPVEMQIRHSQKQTFSLYPVQRMELVENRLAVVLNQDSEQARKFAERANAGALV